MSIIDCNTKCGYVGIIGKPNVGKSTLINYITGENISIVSSLPNTTRKKVLGIKTTEVYQIIFADTPGFCMKDKQEINRYMNRTIEKTIRDIDIVLFVIDCNVLDESDERVIELLSVSKIGNVILCINKMDIMQDKERTNSMIERIRNELDISVTMPISSTMGINVSLLEEYIVDRLPLGVFLYDTDQISDKRESFLISEIMRKSIMNNTRDEIPYSIDVQVDTVEEDDTQMNIRGIIYVNKESQKHIIIGRNGYTIKKISTYARRILETEFGKHIYMRFYVKVCANWKNSQKSLKRFGYE